MKVPPTRFDESLAPFRRALARAVAQVKALARGGSPEGPGGETESHKRYRRATMGAVAGVAARVVALLGVFVSIPIVLAELGPQQFGVWATLSSFSVLLNFADLGISNGLVNMLVRADGEDDRKSAGEYVTSALALLAGVAALLGVMFALVDAVVDWTALYNTGSAVDESAVAQATAVFAVCFLTLLPLGLFQRIHLGYQEGLLAYGWTAAGSLFGLAGLLAASLTDASLPWFVGATTGGPVLAAMLNGVVLLGRSRPWLRPRLGRVTRDSLCQLASTGGTFFVIQVCVAAAFNSGPIIVAQVKGAAIVEDFAVPMRLFAFLPVLLSVAMTAAWPALRSAVLKGEIEWVRTALKRTGLLGFSLVALPTLGLVAFGDAALRRWTGDEIGASTTLLLALGAWALLNAILWPLWMVLVATDALTVLAGMSILMALAGIVLSVELTQSVGIVGVVVGTIVAELIFFVLPAAVYVPRLLRGLERAKIPPI